MIPLPDDYTVRLVDLPAGVGGRIEEGPDGHIDVYINARLSSTGQHTAAYHEWRHWLDDDINSDRDIREVEDRADPERPRQLPPLMRARDLVVRQRIRAAEAAARRDRWEDDIYLRLPYMDE